MRRNPGIEAREWPFLDRQQEVREGQSSTMGEWNESLSYADALPFTQSYKWRSVGLTRPQAPSPMKLMRVGLQRASL